MFGLVSCNFDAARHPFRKRVSGVHKSTSFCHRNHFFVFSQRTCPIHYFRSKTHVWGGFAQFRCRTSPIPKTGVGLHKSTNFCPRNHFFIFRNEHAQSTTLSPNLMFGVVSHNFVDVRHPFRKRVSGVHKSTSFCHQNHFLVFRNEHAQCTTLGPKLMFGVVSRNFVAACHPFRKRVSGCIQSTSFCHRNYFFVFRNEHAQSTTLGPKLMFWVVSHNFVAARHPFRKWVSGVHSKHEFLPPEPFLRFSQRTCPIHYFRSKTNVWGGFAQFRCDTSPIPKTGVGCIEARVFATGTISSFFATNMPNPLL
jgi:hypothetical protein